jgi:glucan biosynthesis protein C
VGIGFYVVAWEASALLKYLVVSLGAMLVTLLLYGVGVRRTRVTRFLVGVK